MRRFATVLGLVALTLGLSVAGGGGWAAAGISPTWSAPTSIEPAGLPAGYGSVYGVSCPNTQMCMAVDETGGALTWRGGRWSAPRPVGADGTLSSVSCASATFCVATSSGQAAVYNGRAWGAAQIVGAPATYQVSCPTTRFCGAVGATGYPGQPSIVATFDGSTWGSTATRSTGTLQDRLLSVSCPQAGRCTAANFDGHVVTLAPGGWAVQRQRIEPGATSVSCPRVSFCMVVGTSYRQAAGTARPVIPAWYVTEVGGRWGAARPIPGMATALFLSVSCASPAQCTAIGLNGKAAQWNSGTWAAPTTVFPGQYSATVDLSCPAVNRCMAVNSQGKASAFG